MSDRDLRADQSDIEWLDSLNAQYLEDHFAAHYSAEDVNDELNAIMAQRNAENASPVSDNGALIVTAEEEEDEEEIVNGQAIQTLCVLCLGPIESLLQPMSLTVSTHKVLDETPQRRISAFGKLNKYRYFGELITLVESLKIERECCDYLDEKLLPFNLPHSSDATLRRAVKHDAKKRFAEAIVDLDRLYNVTSDALEIVKATIVRFRRMRDDIFAHSIVIRQQCHEQFEKVCCGETNDEIRHQLYMELKEFSAIREDIFRIRYDVKINKFTNEFYAQNLSSVKNIAVQIAKFDPFKIDSSFVFSRARNLQLLEHRDHVNEELAELLNDLLRGKKQLEAEELDRREHLYGRQVEIMIIKIPQTEISHSVSSALLSASSFSAKSTRKQKQEHEQQQQQQLQQKIMPTPSKYRHQIYPIIYNEQEKRELRESFSRWYHAVQQWELEAHQARNTNTAIYRQQQQQQSVEAAKGVGKDVNAQLSKYEF